jgi:hypothetical protein
MTFVDDRGRLFGRFNLIDAVVAIFIVGMILLLYGAAALFWAPQPTLASIEPATLAAGQNLSVRIHGQHLKPYLRVSFNDVQGKDFLFRSSTEAEVNLNTMAPGVYDVVLYDVAQERARLPRGLTIAPAPIPPSRMTLVGILGNLDAERAKQLTPGTVIANIGTIRKVGEPLPARFRVNAGGGFVQLPIERAVMLPVEIEAGCDVVALQGTPFCQINGINLLATMVLYGDHALGKLPFQIDQLRGTAALHTLTVTARFSGAPQVLAGIRSGDVDHGVYTNPLAAGATIVSAGASGQADVTLSLQAERGADGWIYASQPLRAGSQIQFSTPRYVVAGIVLQISPEWTAKP